MIIKKKIALFATVFLSIVYSTGYSSEGTSITAEQILESYKQAADALQSISMRIAIVSDVDPNNSNKKFSN